MRSHFRISGGAAMACAVAGATTLLHGNCSAQNLLAADYATNSIYAGGWLAGQNGGFGFGPWSFDAGSGSPVQQGMTYTNSSPFNALGTAWTLYNPVGGPNDVANSGRSFPPLQVGQTVETVFENPTATHFYRGYTISFDDVTNNIPPGSSVGEQVSFYTFEYFSYGKWYVSDNSGNTGTSLFNTNTAPEGAKIDVTLTTTNTYHLVVTPLNNPANSYAQDGTLKLPGSPIDWIQFTFYNTMSDTNSSTDFYISSVTIAGLMLDIQRDGANVVLSWPTNTPGFTLASTTNLGAGAVWSTNLPSPSVVNGQNVVTNSIAGSRQFYRLEQ